MGKMVKWTKARGWTIEATPFIYRLRGLYAFKRYEFAGSLAWYNRRRKPIKSK